MDSIMLCCSEVAEQETPLFDKKDSEIDLDDCVGGKKKSSKSAKRGSAKGV